MRSRRFLLNLAASRPLTAEIDGTAGPGGRVLVDIDDTIIEVHGHAK